MECQLVQSFLFLIKIQLMWNFRKRPSSTAVEKNRKRVGLRRETIFVHAGKPVKRKQTRSDQVSGRGIVPFFSGDNPKPSGPSLNKSLNKLTYFYHLHRQMPFLRETVGYTNSAPTSFPGFLVLPPPR